MSQLTQQSAPPTTQAGPILQAQKIVKTFRMGDSVLQVLKGVDLTVKAGEFLAIEGRAKAAARDLESLRNDLAHGQNITRHDWVPIARLARRIEQLFSI